MYSNSEKNEPFEDGLDRQGRSKTHSDFIVKLFKDKPRESEGSRRSKA